uniref:PDZ domain-containing protein n=1 Tax=Sus scrofa TaxID=9823 RepID=A0A8D1AP58_PIG
RSGAGAGADGNRAGAAEAAAGSPAPLPRPPQRPRLPAAGVSAVASPRPAGGQQAPWLPRSRCGRACASWCAASTATASTCTARRAAAGSSFGAWSRVPRPRRPRCAPGTAWSRSTASTWRARRTTRWVPAPRRPPSPERVPAPRARGRRQGPPGRLRPRLGSPAGARRGRTRAYVGSRGQAGDVATEAAPPSWPPPAPVGSAPRRWGGSWQGGARNAAAPPVLALALESCPASVQSVQELVPQGSPCAWGPRRFSVSGDTRARALWVVQRIKAVEGQTRLLVVDKETDEELRRRQLTCTEEMAQRGLPPALDPWEPKADWAPAGSLSGEAGQKDVNGPLRELRPRLCHLRKGPQGYGFNLHSDKSRPGQYIRSVDPGSPAAHSGLRAQDRLIEVNGQNVEGLRHAEVVACIKAREDEARLLVVDPETDAYFKRLRVTPTQEHMEGPLPSPVTNGTSSAQLNGGSVCSSRSDLPGLDKDTEDSSTWKRDPFQESGLHLSPTAAEAKEKARATRVNKRAPQMDWNRKREIFSNF